MKPRFIDFPMSSAVERRRGVTMVPALIERMDRWLAANRPDYCARLRPGATDAMLNAFEDRFSLRLPEPFRAFYRWR